MTVDVKQWHKRELSQQTSQMHGKWVQQRTLLQRYVKKQRNSDTHHTNNHYSRSCMLHHPSRYRSGSASQSPTSL